MFGLFGKKRNSAEACEFLTQAVVSARIEPHSEKGQYVAFMVFLQCSKAEYRQCAEHKDAVGALLQAVEQRVQAQDFEDPAADIDMVQISRQARGWEPNMLAKRVIVVDGDTPVCAWDIEIDDDGENTITMQHL
jgi:hypothetical protein